jgi:hypothetical protein
MLLGASLLAAGNVQLGAHHAFSSQYDINRPVKFEGKVKRVEWTTPHMWVYVESKKENGGIDLWTIEGPGPNGLLRRGFTRGWLPVGTEVTVDGYRAKNGEFRLSGGSITRRGDGQKMFLRASDLDVSGIGIDAIVIPNGAK